MTLILFKDLEDALRSHSLLFILVGPILLSGFFARSFSEQDLRRPALVYVEEGESGFVQGMRSGGLVRLSRLESWPSARRAVEQGRAVGALRWPVRFDEELRAGRRPRVELLLDESSRTQAILAREAVEAALRRASGQELQADLRVERVREARGEVRLVLLPMWVLFTSLGGLMVTASTLVDEVEKKTLAAVLLTPAGLMEILIGKWMAGFVLALGASALVLLFNAWGVGDPWALGALLGLGALASAGAGTALGLWVRSQAAAQALLSLIYTLLFVPVALADLSDFMRGVAVWTPTWHLHEGISRALLSASPIRELIGTISALLGTNLLVAFIGWWGMRRLRTI